jgi:hypothetical protein
VTVTLTQTDATRPPVGVAVTALPVVDTEAAGSITGIVQRSTDGVRWTTVRGMVDMALDGSGNLTAIDDYEFRPGVVNTYRAGTMQQVAAIFAGSASSAWVNASTGQVWDAANAAFNTTGGFGTILHSAANTTFTTLLSALTDMGDMDLKITFKSNTAAGGIAGAAADVILLAHRTGTSGYRATITFNTDDTVTVAIATNISGDTVVIDTFAVPDLYTASTQVFRARLKIDGPRIRFRLWQPALTPEPDWQFDEIVPAGRRVTGGAPGLSTARRTSNTNTNLTWSFTDLTIDTGIATYLQTQTITPGLSGFWLCSTMRSFLNMAPRVVGYDEPSRGMRGDSAYVAARTLPIAQAELASAREWTLTLHVSSLTAARQLEYVIASGDVFFLQTPADCPIPRGYYRIAKMDPKRIRQLGPSRLFTLPVQECAAPGPDVATASATWTSVIALWGSWPAVVAAEATWEDLLEIIGDPSEVVVE